ncbi:MAG: zinc ribbon domain-containing protein [Anaerolineae bacterium]
MPGRVRSLYILQNTDVKLTEAENRLESVLLALREPEELIAARDGVGEIEARGADARRRLRQKELDLEAVREKLASEEARLYGGSVTHPRELQGLEQEVQSLKRRRSQLEDEVLEVMVAQEETQADLDEMSEGLSLLEDTWKKNQAGLLEEERTLHERVEQLSALREEQAESLGSEDLASYEDLRGRKGSQAVAVVERAVCGGCGVAVPPSQMQKVLRGQELVRCDNCERFLVSEGG